MCLIWVLVHRVCVNRDIKIGGIKMRETQFYGLTSEAKKFIEDNYTEDKVEIYRNGKLESTKFEPKSEVYAHTQGMFDEDLPLHKYFSDKEVITEVVQFTTWSSGLMIFTCLERENGNRLFEWDTKDIE